MKILYIASERSRAQVATRALRAISPNATVLWGSSYERAAFAILENPDLAALIVEVQSDSQGSFYLKQLHSLGLEAPVVMVLPEGAAAPTESLKAGAHHYVAKGPSFSQELPAVVTRAIGGAHAPGVVAEPAVGVPVDRRVPRDVSPAREPERRVTDREPSFNEREQRWASEQSAAAGRQAKLEMLLHQERASRTSVEQKLAEATAALQDAEQRRSAATVAAAQLAERNTQYETGIARATATQKSLEEQLRQSRQSRASAVADVERLTLRNTELSSKLTEATASGNTLERRLAHLEAALDAANERASREHAGAAEQAVGRQAELRAQLEQEIEKRRNVEQELARAKRAHENAENQRSSAMTAATALWAERQAKFDAELATAAEARSTLGREARELEVALDQARQSLQTQATEVERLTQREADLASQLAEAAATRSTLERQLTDTTGALKDASEGASRNRLTAATKAAERELELDRSIRQERTARADVEQRLAQVEAALRDAEQRHTWAMTTAATEVKRLTQREADLTSQLTSQLAEAAAMRSTLERQLTDASTALKDAGDGASRDRLAAETRATERQAQLEIELSRTASTRDEFKRRFTDAETALAATRENHAAAVTQVERLTQRERELISQLAEAAGMRSTLEQRLTDASTALKDAGEDASRDRLAAEMRAAERQAQLEIELSQTASTRDEFKRRFSDAETALAAARHDHSAAAAEVQRLTQRERELTSQLVEAAGMRSTLDQRLTDAADALNDANEGARRDRFAAETKATEREVEFDRLIHHERAARADVEQRLAQVEAALRDTEQQHTSALAAAATERAERQARFDAELAKVVDARNALGHQARELTTEVEGLTRREGQLTSQLAEAAAMRHTLEQRLTDAADALKDANEGARRDRLAAETKAAEHEVEFGRLIGYERATRADVEQRLTQVEAALREAEQQHASAMTAAATERAERQAQFESELSQTAATRDDFKQRLGDTETALAAARHDHEAAVNEVQRLTQREADLTAQLTHAEATFHAAEQQHALAMTAAATEHAERQAQFEIELSQTAATRDDFKQRLGDTETALAAARHDHAAAANEVQRLTQREADLTAQLTHAEATFHAAEQQHALAMTAAATERSERQAQFETELSQTAATRDDFKQRLGDAETALEEARQDHAAAATEVGRLTQREADLTSQLAHAEAAFREARQQHASAMTAAATERAERQKQFETELSQTAATRDDFRQRLGDAETALAAARHDHAAAVNEVQRLTQREADLTSQLTHAEATFHAAEQQHASAMTAAATERAERQAQFETELSQTAATRDDFKQRLGDTETALAAARHDHAAAATQVERLTHREAELTSQLTEAATMRSTLERQLSDAATALTDAKEGAAEREVEFDRLIGHERATRADVEQRLTQETARREGLDQTVADMRSAAADAEQRFRDEFASLTARGRDEVSRLENQFANEREGLERARLTAESEGRRLAAQLTEAKQNLDEARANFEQTLDCVSNEHADSQAKLLATVAERDARIEDVEKQLEESRSELRRQFLRAPLALWRCSRDGALTHANRALADLAGYRQPDELRDADFVNTVFESTDDLSWLIERCVSTKTRQSVETAWKRKKGERLIVRLSAVEFAPDLIEIAVEDVTNAHVLEDRLARAHRMEAVARLASEIAVTCGRLLGDVHEDGQQWLMAVSDDSSLRKRGERLLGEVARAASYLERLAAHGDEQTSALKPVELNRVLRDLKPVLKHVAGDDVELELSKTSSGLNVDMKADRVERLFVNLASYGRERMPVGGRLKIELATVVVDQKFIADHPNVRRGHHALITVTAMRRATATEGTLHIGSTEVIANDVVSEKPGVDLGALQELLQECGGHLWLTVDPPGNMVVKIRLPLRVWDDQPHSDVADPPTSRKGAMARWFRH